MRRARTNHRGGIQSSTSPLRSDPMEKPLPGPVRLFLAGSLLDLAQIDAVLVGIILDHLSLDIADVPAARLNGIPGEIEVHEFDYKKINQVVYDKDGVVIRAWPAVHTGDGPVSYSLEYNRLKIVIGGDTAPNKWYIEYAKNADVAIHECFHTPGQMADLYNQAPAVALWTAGRTEALKVWGPSGAREDMGTRYAIENFKKTYNWDWATRAARLNAIPGEIEVHEFDY